MHFNWEVQQHDSRPGKALKGLCFCGLGMGMPLVWVSQSEFVRGKGEKSSAKCAHDCGLESGLLLYP